jgi:O-acetyl-ADP-ribose deacetylase (regulator of RNase III)
MTITYIKGDATKPIGDDKKLLVHVCNNCGKWGAGFVMAVSKRWEEPEKEYRKLGVKIPENFRQLGTNQYVKVDSKEELIVVNMIAQNGYNTMHRGYKDRLDYDKLETCLKDVNKYAMTNNYSVHMPKIGSGLACGRWTEIEKLIKKVFDPSVQVVIYSWP